MKNQKSLNWGKRLKKRKENIKSKIFKLFTKTKQK